MDYKEDYSKEDKIYFDGELYNIIDRNQYNEHVEGNIGSNVGYIQVWNAPHKSGEYRNSGLYIGKDGLLFREQNNGYKVVNYFVMVYLVKNSIINKST